MKNFIIYNLLNIPLYLCFSFFFGLLYVSNPIDYALLITGHSAIIFLIFILIIPHLLFRFKFDLFWLRRSLGLYVFLYSILHTLIFIGLDYHFDWPLVLDEIKQHLYLQLGVLALFFLLPMAATSNDFVKKVLNLMWFRIHKLIFLVIFISILHYFFLIKLNYYFLIIYSLIFSFLLILPKKNAL